MKNFPVQEGELGPCRGVEKQRKRREKDRGASLINTIYIISLLSLLIYLNQSHIDAALFGYRARTRHMFARKFREHGPTKLSTYMITYKVGDLVDIKANGSIHKGMPHKFYHGRTAVVYNVSPRALGLIVNKRVGNRYMEKRINVRIEHVKPSQSRADFLRRVQENDAARKSQGCR